MCPVLFLFKFEDFPDSGKVFIIKVDRTKLEGNVQFLGQDKNYQKNWLLNAKKIHLKLHVNNLY